MDAAGELTRGRTAYSTRAWLSAYESLSRADQVAPLNADDLEALATSAYMLGRDDDYVRTLERAYRLHLDADESLRAARCAFWLGLTLMLRGGTGRSAGWLGRALRIVERTGSDCVERGYLQIPEMFRLEAVGDLETAATVAADAAATGERFGDPDLFALAAHSQGALLVKLGRAPRGLALMDEAMLAVTAGELSPIASGLVYCGVIMGCQEAYEPGRAQEWTAALTQWCDQQPDMVAFTGRCLTHRAEILCLHGAWEEALDEARRAARRCAQGGNELAERRGDLRAGGGPSPARRVRRGRDGLPGREPVRPRAPARPGAAAAGAGRGRARGRRDPPRAGRGRRAAAARPPAARLRRDHAGRRRRRGRAGRLRRARADRGPRRRATC